METGNNAKISPMLMISLVKKFKRRKTKKEVRRSMASTVLNKQRKEISFCLCDNKENLSRRMVNINSVSRTRTKLRSGLFNTNSELYINSILHSSSRNILPKVHTPASQSLKKTKSKTVRNLVGNKQKEGKKGVKRGLSNRTGFELVNKLKIRKRTNILHNQLPRFVFGIYKNKQRNYNDYPIDNRARSEIYLYRSELLIFGGFGVSFTDEIMIYNKKLDRPFIKTNKRNARIKFACVGVGSHFIVHGGETNYNSIYTKVLNDMFVVDITKLRITSFHCVNGDFPYKKGHIMFVIGDDIFLEGGAQKHSIKNTSIYVFNITTRRQRKITMADDFQWLTQHRCVTVKQNFDTLSFYQLVKESTKLSKDTIQMSINRINKEKHEESFFNDDIYRDQKVFVFGGLNIDNVPSDVLYTYTHKRKDLVIEYPETKGAKPRARYDHQMTYIKEINSIAVVGGKTKNSKGEEIILGDLWLLETERLYWINICIDLKARYGFSLSCNKGDLLIFGGYSEQNLTDGYVKQFELEKKLIKEYEGFFNSTKKTE